jgi:glycosyltransferase involved in cell wall biosynthesis
VPAGRGGVERRREKGGRVKTGYRAPRVLFYFEDDSLSQSEQAIVALLDRLDRERYPFRVLVTSLESRLAELARASGYGVDAIPLPAATGTGARAALSRWGGWLAYYRKLFRYFRMYRFEVVHAVGARAASASIGIKVRFNTPLVWHLWSVIPGGLRLWGFRRLASLFCDHVFASSLVVAHQLGRRLRWRDHLHVVYRGYPRSARAAGGREGAGAPVLAIAGGLGPWRGYPTFLRALELVRREIPECRGLIVARGDEPSLPGYDEELKRLLAEMGLEAAVEIESRTGTEALEAVAARGSSVVLVAGSLRPEPFDASVAEAMGSGVPVVAARGGVCDELVSHETTGLLATAGDANELAQAALRLLRDRELRERIVANARQEFETRFDLGRYVATISGVYERYLEPGEAPAAVDELKKAA